MVPMVFSYSPVTADDDGYATAATGATWPLLRTNSGDNLAHKVTIISTTDLTLITAVIVGTDSNGNALTESLALVDNNTATSTNYFKTVTSITPSATIAAATVKLGWAAASVGPTVALDWAVVPFDISLAGMITGTINFTVQYTYNDIFDPAVTPIWFPHASLTSKSANTDGSQLAPVRAVRLLINTVTNSATIQFAVIQG